MPVIEYSSSSSGQYVPMRVDSQTGGGAESSQGIGAKVLASCGLSWPRPAEASGWEESEPLTARERDARQASATKSGIDTDGGESAVEDPMIEITKWMTYAERGELDFYTCLGLTNICIWTSDSPAGIAKFIAVLILQLVVPLLMLGVEMQKLHFYAVEPSLSFRLLGFFLYIYSVWHMYANALDECRDEFLTYAFKHRLPIGMLLPALVGEFANSLVSFVLVLTLFVIYCNSYDAQDLVLNAVAINFLGNIDIEFVDEDMKEIAIEKFKDLVLSTAERENREGAGKMSLILWIVEATTTYTMMAVRIGGTLFCGIVLSLIFLLSHQSNLCNSFESLQETLVCD